MQGRLGAERTGQRLGPPGHDASEVEVPQSLLERVGRDERPFHRHLLVEQHAEQERERVGVQEFVGGGIAGYRKGPSHWARFYGRATTPKLNASRTQRRQAFAGAAASASSP